jgi:4-amino-4-deoxy-L-arabinose transferase-like glycosyltransferase
MELRTQFARYVSKVNWIPVFGVLFFFLFQMYQLTAFNSYWGYDGGAHVHILETLLYEHRFPSLTENYLAWHEPFYYVVLVGFGFLHVPFWVSHAVIILGLDILVFVLWRRLGFSNSYAFFGTIATLSLPAFLEVSMYYTNEALNYVFVLAIVYCGLTLWREEAWSWKTSMMFAVGVGLGVVTKITALVAFGVVAILLIVKMFRTRVWKYVGTIFLTLVVAIGCYAPWYVIRSQGLSQASINNYDMLPARAFAWDERVTFFTRFDADIFVFPFWYSGGTGFWSMLYADTVSDYLGIFENQDRKNALSESERVFTTHNGNSVSAYRKPLAQAAMWLGLVPVGVMMLGMFCALRGLVQQLREKRFLFTDELVVLGFSSAFLLALMYYAYRYPYYDQGVVKSIFIAPAFVLPLALGTKYLSQKQWWIQFPVGLLWGGYIVAVLSLFFVYS